MPSPTVSIIIPTLDEAANVARLLGELAGGNRPHEIIIADGGSRDETRTLARAHGARVIVAPRGRGAQLAAGAMAARGDILWFLHADSRVAPGSLAALADALADPAAVGGNFALVFDGADGFSRWLTRFYCRLRGLGLYYGDSGIFVRRDIYQRLGGIRQMALMEDYDFARRLERAGPTRCIEAPPLVTSSRRFRGRRPAAIVAGWVAIHLLYHLGVPPGALARFYYGRWLSPRRPQGARLRAQS
ncbi:MAG: TIGR04283 family arsenosugar biosynthesis glycosyltransferase [Rhodospirillales bacterium]|nr:TIGR04283 family arsenosugar biosynthesis glycosyltransferase [Rhodospirillales bacterium]